MCECRQHIKEIMWAHRRCNVRVTDYCGMRYPEIIASPDPEPIVVAVKTEEVRPPTEAPEAVPECAETCVDETSGGESDPGSEAEETDLGSCVNEAELADREAQEAALREQIARLELDKMRLKRRRRD